MTNQPRQHLYTLDELLDNNIIEPPQLIEKLVGEEDNVIILGDAKVGKSLFSMQMAFSLTAGDTFLDSLKCYKQCKVLYVQAEGKRYETFSRAKKMAKEVPHKRGGLIWAYLPMVPMDKEDSFDQFTKLLGTFEPDVIFFDPLYMLASTGSLTQDDVAIRIVSTLNRLKARYSATIILNHHSHRVKRKEDGGIIDEGDNSIFGSFVWKAWPDTILLFQKKRGESNSHVRKLSCDTQRSGGIMKVMELLMVEPNPLFFEILENMTPIEHMIFKLIEKQKGVTKDQLCEITNCAKSTLNKALRRLVLERKIWRINNGDSYRVLNKTKESE